MLHNFSGKKWALLEWQEFHDWNCCAHNVWLVVCVLCVHTACRQWAFCEHVVFKCPGFPPALEQSREGTVQDDPRLLQQKSLGHVFALRSSQKQVRLWKAVECVWYFSPHINKTYWVLLVTWCSLNRGTTNLALNSPWSAQAPSRPLCISTSAPQLGTAELCHLQSLG